MPTQQILQIKPDSELVFKGPYDKVVTSALKLKNPSGNVVAFKVKTTAPKRYCVRPNSGLLQPNSEVEVAVMLQPFEYDPADKSARHKFMVQSLVVAINAVDSLDDLWKSATADSLMDSKLKVVLDPGADDPPPAAQVTVSGASPVTAASAGAIQTTVAPAAASAAAVPSIGIATTASGTSAASAAAPSTPPTPAGATQVVGESSGIKLQQQQQKSISPVVQRKTAPSEFSSTPAPQPQLPGAPADAVRSLQSEIQRLRDENSRLSEQELRLRKLAMRDTKSADTASSAAAAAAASSSVGSSHQQQLQQHPPAMPPVLFLVLALVLGLIVGKFIL